MSGMQQNRLLAIMRRELESWQLQFSPYCTHQIEHLIGNGIKRMRTNNTLDHAGYMMQAERNLAALIKYFCDYSKKVGAFPELSDSDFDAAVRTCPTLWPYSTSG